MWWSGMSWHLCCPASSAGDIPSLIQVVSHSVLACLFSDDLGGLQHVLVCLSFQAALRATWHEWCRWTPTCLGMFVLQPELQAVTPGDTREWSGRLASNVTEQKERNGLLAKGVAGIYVTEDLSVTKRINVMVGITRSNVICLIWFFGVAIFWSCWDVAQKPQVSCAAFKVQAALNTDQPVMQKTSRCMIWMQHRAIKFWNHERSRDFTAGCKCRLFSFEDYLDFLHHSPQPLAFKRRIVWDLR